MEDNHMPRPTPGPTRRPVIDIKPRPSGPQLTPIRSTSSTPAPPLPQTTAQPAFDAVKKIPEPPVPVVDDKPPKAGAPKLAVMLAFVIAIVLAVLTVAAYYYARKDTPKRSNSSPETTQPESEPAHAADVDEATSAIDEATAPTDPSQEFPESDLTDQALGL